MPDRFKGDTPANYFSRFKRVLKAATKDGYYRTNPCEDVAAKKNPSPSLKENLEIDEYLCLLNTPFFNQEITEGFIFGCYTGLRYVDVSSLTWDDIRGGKLVTRIIQAKTGLPVTLTLHPIAGNVLAVLSGHSFPATLIFIYLQAATIIAAIIHRFMYNNYKTHYAICLPQTLN